MAEVGAFRPLSNVPSVTKSASRRAQEQRSNPHRGNPPKHTANTSKQGRDRILMIYVRGALRQLPSVFTWATRTAAAIRTTTPTLLSEAATSERIRAPLGELNSNDRERSNTLQVAGLRTRCDLQASRAGTLFDLRMKCAARIDQSPSGSTSISP